MKYKYEIETLSGTYLTNDWRHLVLADPGDPCHKATTGIIVFFDQYNKLRAIENAEINLVKEL